MGQIKFESLVPRVREFVEINRTRRSTTTITSRPSARFIDRKRTLSPLI